MRRSVAPLVIIVTVMMLSFSCRKYREYSQKPELEPLQHGLKTSMAVGYCASVAASAFEGKPLPANVTFDKNLGLIYIKFDQTHPLPFNQNIGDIVVAGAWHQNSGVISILFANFDLLSYKIKIYGINTVPVIDDPIKGITTILAKQDVIISSGADTILDLSNMSSLLFNNELDRLNTTEPNDVNIAVKQNVWFVNIDRAGTYDNVYDDNFRITGGGQMVEMEGSSGGILYHAIIDAKYNYSVCPNNPTSGIAFTQNLKAGGEPAIDLGNSLLSFHSACDGMAHVDFSCGKYVTYNNKNIALNLK
jgi:hypothetical protein